MRDGNGTRQAWIILSACAVLTVTALVLMAPAVWSVARNSFAAATENQPSQPLAERSESPEYWITDQDYPVIAILNDEQGRVGVAIDFDADGMPVNCGVTGSSGSAALDRITCALVLKRGRTAPSQRGTSRTLNFRWVLPH